MKLKCIFGAWLVLMIGAGFRANAQAVATASANTRISAFAGIGVNFTGVSLAKNTDVTVGVDIGTRPFAGFYPSLEARGMYPIGKGNVVSEENLLGGIKIARRKDRFHGYGDVLFGRGKLNFLDGGYPDPTDRFLVVSNTSSVLSLGGGIDIDMSEHFGFKGDVQLQRYDSPVAATGQLYSKVFTVGVIYRLGFRKIR